MLLWRMPLMPAGLPSVYSWIGIAKADDMGKLTIERLGGFAGFGGPHLKSEGQLALADLSPDDRAKVEKLFEIGSKPPVKKTNDVFNYRITLQNDGRSQTVEVPESLVPAALISSVKDTLK